MSTPERRCRVVQWSSGGVGALAIAAIRGRPDLELVGVWVHSPWDVPDETEEEIGLVPTTITSSWPIPRATSSAC